jgi:hypothetical protein
MRRRMRGPSATARPWAAVGVCAAALLGSEVASAGTFDATGALLPDPAAVAGLDFEVPPERFVPADAPIECVAPAFEHVVADDAVDGGAYARVVANLAGGCAERFVIDMPSAPASYSARIWVRHGMPEVNLTVVYPDDSGLETGVAVMGPTGRVTSDGWVELASNALPIDPTLALAVYVRVIQDRSALDGADVDALELFHEGPFEEPVTSCTGAKDPTCQGERTCVTNRCVLGRTYVPPLPSDALRGPMVDMFQSRLRTFFGGRRTRLENLPIALATLDEARSAKTAFQFWSLWGRSVRELRDWHTYSRGPIQGAAVTRHTLGVCFIEGDADRSHDVLPRHPKYADVLVSHVGTNNPTGLAPGDRLVAVDGQHPLEWMDGLLATDWSHHAPSDPESFADYAEDLGGRSGQSRLLRFAKTFSVIRCDAATDTCSDVVETIEVSSLPPPGGGGGVTCDNRPLYHLEPGKNPPASHNVGYDFFRGRVANTTEEEAIYGMIWDTLYGGGEPNGLVNGQINQAIAAFKAEARGVILDHRTGNGGTLDAPTNLTRLVRPPSTMAIIRMPMQVGGYDGPSSQEEGLSLFEAFEDIDGFSVGAVDHDPELPVALLLHRDGSASDYMPYGMKGAPKTKLFAPHGTAGAFSTYIELGWWAGLSLQLASGDTIGFDGSALIGHGVQPDVVVEQRQSDLMQGKDTIWEAALAWVRSELKP